MKINLALSTGLVSAALMLPANVAHGLDCTAQYPPAPGCESTYTPPPSPPPAVALKRIKIYCYFDERTPYDVWCWTKKQKVVKLNTLGGNWSFAYKRKTKTLRPTEFYGYSTEDCVWPTKCKGPFPKRGR